MTLWQIILLAVIQGLAELLPVSSSAHVIFAQHLMGLDPSAPEMTLLLVMLHTGTMFAVLVYFWSRWKKLIATPERSKTFFKNLVLATMVTGIIGLSLKFIIEKVIFERLMGYPKGEIEQLFKMLPLMGASLFAAGILIIFAGLRKKESIRNSLNGKESIGVGLIQGLCLPFRGFSRSGATISLALLQGISREYAEEFSFALAILLTPPVIFLELNRLLKVHTTQISLYHLLWPSLIGMLFSFFAGLLALRWLSSWLETGRWHLFGYYCLVFSVVVFTYYGLHV